MKKFFYTLICLCLMVATLQAQTKFTTKPIENEAEFQEITKKWINHYFIDDEVHHFHANFFSLFGEPRYFGLYFMNINGTYELQAKVEVKNFTEMNIQKLILTNAESRFEFDFKITKKYISSGGSIAETAEIVNNEALEQFVSKITPSSKIRAEIIGKERTEKFILNSNNIKTIYTVYEVYKYVKNNNIKPDFGKLRSTGKNLKY